MSLHHHTRAAVGGVGGNHDITFRRTDADRRPPSRVLTGALLGDPDGQRLERDRAARIRLGIIDEVEPALAPQLAQLLRLLAPAPLRGQDIEAGMGLTRSSANKWERSAMTLGLVEREGRGSKTLYRLTREGRSTLEAQPQ